MSSITLEQFLTLRPSGRTKDYHTGTSNLPPVAHQLPVKPIRSNSLGSVDEPLERVSRFTRKYKEGKMAEDRAIQAPFTTLAETFKKVGCHLGPWRILFVE